MEIYVLDNQINILGVFSTYESILWTEKVHEPGTFKAVFLFTQKMNNILNRGNLLYKTDEVQPGIIKRKFLKIDKYGQKTIVIQGFMANRYLNQRIIWKKMIMRGTPEQIMRQMVEEQVINPEDNDRKMPLIEMGDFKGYDDAKIEKQVSYDNLQESLTDVSKISELGYRLRLDFTIKKFLFEVYKGMDRTIGSETPCIFSIKYKNVYTQEYSEDDSNYRNICLVGGPGEDDERILVSVGEASGLDRYEFFYNASGLSEKDITAEELINQLRQKGKEKTATYPIAKSFESKINQKKAMTYALGDYVTCTNPEWGVTIDTQVKAIQKGLSKKEESLLVTFGDSIPSLINLIKAKE